MSVDDTLKSNKKKQKKRKFKITFDQEIIPKESAAEISSKIKKPTPESKNEISQKQKRKKRKNKNNLNDCQQDTKNNDNAQIEQTSTENDDEIETKYDVEIEKENNTIKSMNNAIKSKKNKKRKMQNDNTSNTSIESKNQGVSDDVDTANTEIDKTETEDNNEEVQNELDPKNPEIKKSESIRAKKRKKHAQLVLDKKMQTELKLQEKALNYLSQWRYNRTAWKFEKFRQIWLQEHMFDIVFIPDKFWDSLVEYFSSAKGKARDDVIKSAVKIIEEHDNVSEEEKQESVKFNRAQAIVQALQE